MLSFKIGKIGFIGRNGDRGKASKPTPSEPYLKAEPKVVWVQNGIKSVVRIFSNINWMIY